MKTIKIIDLLNKIAKGEIELGTKFIWHYKFNDITLSFMERCGALGLFFEEGLKIDGEIRWVGLFERYNYSILNDEVEIIEEEQDIEELDVDEMMYQLEYGNIKISEAVEVNAKKINELIKAVNKIKNKED